MLTPVGAAVVAGAQQILRGVDDLIRIADEYRDPFGGDLRMGIIPTVAPYLLPRMLPVLKKEFPKVALKLTEGQTVPITRMLADGELDAAADRRRAGHHREAVYRAVLPRGG